MTIEVQEITLPEQVEVKIEFSITAKINVTDVTAQRKVSKLLLEQVGNLLYGEQPSLVAGRWLLWRVPVWLGLPTVGAVGQVGVLDVDAQTGEILFTQQLLDEIAERGDEVVAGIEADQVAVFDPGLPIAPALVSTGNLLLAWSHFDYTYAVLTVP